MRVPFCMHRHACIGPALSVVCDVDFHDNPPSLVD